MGLGNHVEVPTLPQRAREGWGNPVHDVLYRRDQIISVNPAEPLAATAELSTEAEAKRQEHLL
jgi:hypothetical protein